MTFNGRFLCRRLGPLLIFLALFALGCGGGSSGPKLQPVTGNVTFKGKKLPGALVAFYPIETTTGNGGTGKTDADGKYTITYRRGGEGLPAGKYKVTVSKRIMPDGTEPAKDVQPMDSPAKETIPAQYSNEEGTILVKTVSEGGGAIALELK